MNPDYKVSNKLIYAFNGVPIAEMESVKTAQVIHKEIKNGEDFAIYNKETTVKMENVQFDEGQLTKLILPNETLTAIGTGYKFPRGKNFPKKKRIRKKWMKKYGYKFELKDCMVF